MQRPQRVIALTILLTASAALAWRHAHSLTRSDSPADISPGECYAVACSENACTLDLDFSPSTRYVLIVGSLDSAQHVHHIDFQSHTVDAVTRSPISPMKQFEALPCGRTRAGLNARRIGSPSQNTANIAEREFFIHVTDGNPDDPKHYARVVGRCLAESPNVRVFLDSQQRPAELADGLVDEVVHLFDTVVLPTSRNCFGSCRDIDGDGKFTILLSPWLDRLQGGRTSLGGFVREGDFRLELDVPFSNHSDMLCLNSNLHPDGHLCTLLMHEFTHAVCFSERLASKNPSLALPPEEDWLNEALAHVSENMVGSKWSNLDYRISRFLNDPEKYPLVVEDYFGTGMWRNHGCRGATYLFLRWCVDQYGDGLAAKLVHSPTRGMRSLEWATGQSFDELFRRWSIALFESGRTAPSDGSVPSSESIAVAVQPPRPGDFHAIELRGVLADWGLAGPRAHQWNVDGASREISVRGTACAFLELASNDRPGVRRIFLRGDAGSRLQVSLLRLDDGWPKLMVQADWADSISPDTSRTIVLASADQAAGPDIQRGRGPKRDLLIRISSPGHSCSVETIACERNFGETRESLCFSGDYLASLRQPRLSSDGRADCEVYALKIPPASHAADPQARHLRVKVLAHDGHGRRASAWLTVNEPVSPELELTAADENSTQH